MEGSIGKMDVIFIVRLNIQNTSTTDADYEKKRSITTGIGRLSGF